MHTYAHTHTYIHTYIHTHVHACIYMQYVGFSHSAMQMLFMCEYMRASMCNFADGGVYVCLIGCMCVCVCLCVCACTHAVTLSNVLTGKL